jgi:hypothetical protein
MKSIDEFEAIVKLLDIEDEDIQTRTSGCMWNLATLGNTTREALTKLGALEKLYGFLDSKEPELVCNSSMCISILAASDKVSEKLREMNGIDKIVELLNHDDKQVQQNAAGKKKKKKKKIINKKIF